MVSTNEGHRNSRACLFVAARKAIVRSTQAHLAGHSTRTFVWGADWTSGSAHPQPPLPQIFSGPSQVDRPPPLTPPGFVVLPLFHPINCWSSCSCFYPSTSIRTCLPLSLTPSPRPSPHSSALTLPPPVVALLCFISLAFPIFLGCHSALAHLLIPDTLIRHRNPSNTPAPVTLWMSLPYHGARSGWR